MNIYLKKKFKICLISILSVLAVTFSAIALFTVNTAKADIDVNETEQVLPLTALEFTELSAPTDAYSDGVVTAVIQGTDPSTLLICNGKETTTLTAGQLTDVKRFDENHLIFSSEARLKIINLSGNLSTVSDYNLDSTNSATSFFDLSDDYLITAYDSNLQIFKFEQKMPVQIGDSFEIDNKSHVAINNDNQMFFVFGGAIYRLNLTDTPNQTDAVKLTEQTVNPGKMIANDHFIYYIENSKIFRLSVNGGAPVELSIEGDDVFELGNVSTVKGISFKGENLLLTDNTTVQEFSINNQTLCFTGYAIAKNKSAYNRVSIDTKEVEQSSKSYAVLDKDKLLVVTPTANAYARANFYNLMKGTIDDTNGVTFKGEMPDTFALGDDKILLSYGHDVTGGKIQFFDLIDKTFSQKVSNGDYIVRDICYQNGYFYLLADNGNAPALVYRFSSEDDLNFNTPYFTANNFTAKQLAVDVYQNIYLSNGTTVKKYDRTDGAGITINLTFNLIKKMATDLGGNLLILDSGDLYYLYNDGEYKTEKINFTNHTEKIKSFSMGYDKKTVNLLFENQQITYSTDNLPNLSIDGVTIPTDYKLTGSNADFNALKVYARKDGQNVYQVNTAEQTFKFISLVEDTENYLYIADATISNNYSTVTFLVLVEQDKTILIDKALANAVTDSVLNVTDSVPTQAYISTGVNGYYLPILNANSTFALTDAQVIRLEKNTVINPKKQLTYLDKVFYFAEFTVDGTTYNGYIPKDYTVEILAKDVNWSDFKVQKLKACDVFSDQALENKVLSFDKGVEVRLIEEQKYCVKIAYQVENDWVIGYVEKSALDDKPKVSVRNILLILLVTACICGTTTYFLVRNKKSK